MRKLRVFTKEMLDAFDFEKVNDNYYVLDRGYGFMREVLFDPYSKSVLVLTTDGTDTFRDWLEGEDELAQYFIEHYKYEADYEEEYNKVFNDHTIKDPAEYMND